VFISPTVVGDAVIAGSCAGTAYALDRKTGKPIWSYDTSADGSAAQFHGEPLLLSGRVVVPTDADPKGHIYAFDSASGDPLWKLAFNQGVAATPLLIDGRIVAVSAEGEVVAVDPAKGEVAWHQTPAGALKPQPYMPSPAYAGKRIFFADNTNRLFALNAATGETIWRETLAARTTTALVVSVPMLGDSSAHAWLAIHERLHHRPHELLCFRIYRRGSGLYMHARRVRKVVDKCGGPPIV